jgi:hypothetical protein
MRQTWLDRIRLTISDVNVLVFVGALIEPANNITSIPGLDSTLMETRRHTEGAGAQRQPFAGIDIESRC